MITNPALGTYWLLVENTREYCAFASVGDFNPVPRRLYFGARTPIQRIEKGFVAPLYSLRENI